MRDNGLVCWKCGQSVGDEPLPLGRLAECRACGAQLHVCRMCRFYDTRVAKACRETVAEAVQDKTRANFCGYFEPRARAYLAPGPGAGAARAELDALFGDTVPADKPDNALDDLFRKDG